MVMKGKRPPKPADASRLGLTSAMWKLVQDCWNKRRDKRPEIQYIASRLRSEGPLEAIPKRFNEPEPVSGIRDAVVEDPLHTASDSTAHCEFEILILP